MERVELGNKVTKCGRTAKNQRNQKYGGIVCGAGNRTGLDILGMAAFKRK